MRLSSIRCGTAAGALITSLALAACGSGSSKPAAATSAASTPVGSSTTSQSTSTVTATATATASSTTSTAQSGAAGSGTSGSGGAGIGTLQGSTPECKAASLSVAYLGQQGATGNGELGFAMRNTSSATCITGGYPGIQFLDQAGTALPTKPTRSTSDFFGTTTLQRVVLHPGDTASFRLAVAHAGGSSPCTLAYGLQIIAPDDTASMVAHIPSGAEQCGDASVSPMQPGTSAYR